MKNWYFLLIFLFLAMPARSQTLSLDILGAGQKTVHVYIAPSLIGEKSSAELVQAGKSLQMSLQHFLGYLSFFEMVSSSQIVGETKLQGLDIRDIDFRQFSLSKVDMLIASRFSVKKGQKNAFLELRVFDVLSGSFLFGKEYTVLVPEQVEEAASRFCAALMTYLTGSGSFFESEIAFVQKKGRIKEIATVSPQGTRLKQRTFLNALALSPVWSPDGEKILFSYIGNKEHRLGIWSRKNNSIKSWSMPGNSCISPTFTPSGQAVVSLDIQGVLNIYLLKDNFQVDRELVASWAVDITPSFDKSEKKMTFVSGRLGNPHVFLLDRDSGKVKRLTFKGKYNTGAKISPDGKNVLFSRMEQGSHRIFLLNLESGFERQLTFGPGNDEEPCWSPDGFFLAFSSNRSGKYQLYLTNIHGETPQHIATGEGEAMAPNWQMVSLGGKKK